MPMTGENNEGHEPFACCSSNHVGINVTENRQACARSTVIMHLRYRNGSAEAGLRNVNNKPAHTPQTRKWARTQDTPAQTSTTSSCKRKHALHVGNQNNIKTKVHTCPRALCILVPATSQWKCRALTASARSSAGVAVVPSRWTSLG